MEDLGSDATIEMMKHLPGKDILSVCQTSRKLHRICSGERYNRLWQQKLQEELNMSYPGERAFDKYVELSKLYVRTFYNVIQFSGYDSEADSYLFENKDDAIDFIIKRLIEMESSDLDYFNVRNILETGENYDLDDSSWFKIEEIKLKRPGINLDVQRDNYNLIQRKIREEFPNQNKHFYEEINNFLRERENVPDEFFKRETKGVPDKQIKSLIKRLSPLLQTMKLEDVKIENDNGEQKQEEQDNTGEEYSASAEEEQENSAEE